MATTIKKTMATGKVAVMLGNGCKRYITPAGIGEAISGKLFEAAVKYLVTEGEREELYKLEDENGVRFFYDAALIEQQMKAQAKKRRDQLAASGDEEAQRERVQESEEIDTGVVSLGGVGVRPA